MISQTQTHQFDLKKLTNGPCMTGFMGHGKMQIVKKVTTFTEVTRYIHDHRGVYCRCICIKAPIILRLSFCLG